VADEQLSLEPEVTEVDTSEVDQLRTDMEALQTQLQSTRLENARLEERAKPPAPAGPTPEPVITRAQLQAAVDEGTITQDLMNEALEKQAEARVLANVTEQVNVQTAQHAHLQKLQNQFDSYLTLKPDVKVDGSADRLLVQKEIEVLVGMGQEYNLQTELLAMRNVFGPVDRVQETTRLRRESTQEAGGGGEDPAAPSGGNGWRKGLTSGQVKEFERQLARTVYQSEDDKFFQKVVLRARTDNVSKGAAA